MTFTPTTKISLSPGIPWQRMHDQVLILDSKRSRAHELNKTAALLWLTLSNGPCPVQALTEMLCQQFGQPAAKVENDISQFLERMQGQGLIECH